MSKASAVTDSTPVHTSPETSFDRLNLLCLPDEKDAAFIRRLGITPGAFRGWKKRGGHSCVPLF